MKKCPVNGNDKKKLDHHISYMTGMKELEQ